MAAVDTPDTETVAAAIAAYLGPDDPRIKRLRSLSLRPSGRRPATRIAQSGQDPVGSEREGVDEEPVASCRAATTAGA